MKGWIRMAAAVAAATLSAWVSPVPAADAGGDGLATGCEPMHLLVEEPNEHVERLGFDLGAVELRLVLALHGRRLLVSGEVHLGALAAGEIGPQFLYLGIDASHASFLVNVRLYRWMLDGLAGAGRYAAVWQARAYGVHGDDGAYVLRAAEREAEGFLAAYLEANVEACAAREGR